MLCQIRQQSRNTHTPTQEGYRERGQTAGQLCQMLMDSTPERLPPTHKERKISQGCSPLESVSLQVHPAHATRSQLFQLDNNGELTKATAAVDSNNIISVSGSHTHNTHTQHNTAAAT